MVAEARNSTLEARIAANPDDADAYLVYADYLQGQNDPRGELIMLQHQGKDAEAQELIDNHIDYFLGPLKAYQLRFDTYSGNWASAFTWKLGFIHSVDTGFDTNAVGETLKELHKRDDELELEDNEISMPDLVQKLFAHPSAMFLNELVVRVNMLDDGCYFADVAKAIAEAGHPLLRSLRLGKYRQAAPRSPSDSDYDYENSWTSFGDLSGLWKALPRLEKLVLQGCMGTYAQDSATLGEIVAPNLKHLELISGGIRQENIQSVANANLPELRYLDLWSGDTNYGFTGSIDDIQRILDGEGLPKLTHLGLLNSELANEICERLPDAKILPQLTELSLALGTMNDRGAQALAADKERLAHLKMIDLEENFLSQAGTALVKDLCPDVRLGEQRENEEDEDEDEEDSDGLGGRYVALGE